MGRGGRKLPFFFMGIYNNKKTVVASATFPLLDLKPELLKESVLKSMYRKANLVDVILEDAINGYGPKMRSVFKYGAEEYYPRLPRGNLERLAVRDEDIITFLEGLETLPVTLESVTLEIDDPYIDIEQFLQSQRGLNRLTDRLTYVPELIEQDLNAQKDAYYTDVVVPAEEARVAALRGSVPVNRTIETDTTLDGVSVVEVKNITVDSDENYDENVVIDNPTYISNRQLNVDAEGNNVTGGNYYWVITYNHRLHVTYYCQSNISYVESIETYYRYPDGTTTEPEYTTEDPVTLLTGLETYADSFFDASQETYICEFETGMRYYYIEWYVEDADGLRTPRHLYFKEGFGNGTGAEFPTEVFLTPTPFYPVVNIRLDNEDLFAESRQEHPEYITSIELMKILKIDLMDIVDGVNQNPDIDKIDHAFIMFGINLTTENKGCIRYLCDFFEYYGKEEKDLIDLGGEDFIQDPIDNINRYSDGGPKDLTSLFIQEGNLNMVLDWSRIEITHVNSTINEGYVGYVNKVLSVNDAGNHILDLYHQFLPNTYKHIRVYGLKHINRIFQAYTTQTDIQDLLDDPENNSFIIPLRADLVEDMNIIDQNTLFYDAMHLVFYSIETTKLKWYETSVFRAIMIVISVILLIYTGINLTSGLMTAAAGGTLALVLYVIEIILYMILTRIAFKWIADKLGAELAFIVAAIALALGLSAGAGYLDPSWADTLLQLSGNILTGLAENIQDEMADLVNATKLFSEEAKALTEHLKEIEESLDVDSLIDPFYFINTGPKLNVNETPDQFFERSVHLTNPGVLAYDMIHSFVDAQLALPDPTHDFEVSK